MRLACTNKYFVPLHITFFLNVCTGTTRVQKMAWRTSVAFLDCVHGTLEAGDYFGNVGNPPDNSIFKRI